MMRNGLQNLLVFLALCLCGLVAFQWHRETKLRLQLQSSNENVHSKAETIENLQKSLRVAEEEVNRLESLRSGMVATMESNRLEVSALNQQLQKAQSEIGKSARQLEAFKSSLEQANANIRRQNESMKKLSGERNDAVIKFNALVEKYNDLVKKWNAVTAVATNRPARQ